MLLQLLRGVDEATYVPPMTMNMPTRAMNMWKPYLALSAADPDLVPAKSCIQSMAGKTRLKGAKQMAPARPRR